MKNIKIKKLEKYENGDYEEVAFSVYKDKNNNWYCFAFECELEEDEDQYLLEDLLDKYNVSCTEYYGKPFMENGVKKSIVEVKTLNDELECLISILNFSTIVDKQVNNFNYKDCAFVGINYGNGKIILKENERELPIYAPRNNGKTDNFCMKYPEGQLKTMFEKGIDITEHIEGEIKLQLIMLKDSSAHVVYTQNEKDYELIYNLKGFVSKEEVR